MAGDLLELGRTTCLVAKVKNYTSFKELIEDVGVEALLSPAEADSIRDAIAVYHSFPHYEELAQLHGVRAFFLQPPPDEAEVVEKDMAKWTTEQNRFLERFKADVTRSLAVTEAVSQADADAAREECFQRNNKILILEGPPGSGKTTILHAGIKWALAQGGSILLTAITAQFISRMRTVFGDSIHLNTCHAGLGFDEDVVSMSACLGPYNVVAVDEFSQLNGEQLAHIETLRKHNEYVACFVMAGDRHQQAGFGECRVWESPLWRKITFATNLKELHRCKDPDFKKMLGALRTSRPAEGRESGKVRVEDIMRDRRAWPGHEPEVPSVRRILNQHPDTTMLACTRRGAATLDDLCLQAKYPRRQPVAVLDGDIESNPENYGDDCKLKAVQNLVARLVPIFIGMRVYLTRNVCKDTDYVNGMLCIVEDFDDRSRALRVITQTGHRLAIFPWTDKELNNMVYYPVRPGYASTIIKFAGAELPHVTLWLDCPNIPGAAYTGMSRVAYGRDLLIGGNVNKYHFTPAI